MKLVRDITVIMAYYLNASMLTEQYASFRKLPAEMKHALRLIIVDDGSPVPAFKPAPDLGMPFELYRVGVDVRWNQDACRNIGVHHAQTPWVLLTDMDHMIPEATLAHVLTAKLNPQTVYRFARVDAPDMTPYKPHVNSWLMTKATYNKAGGYDERFAGWYGTDGDFRNHINRVAQTEILGVPLVRVPREVIPDASTVTYERKTVEDGINIRRIKAERAREKDQRQKRLTFPYSRVA